MENFEKIGSVEVGRKIALQDSIQTDRRIKLDKSKQKNSNLHTINSIYLKF